MGEGGASRPYGTEADAEAPRGVTGAADTLPARGETGIGAKSKYEGRFDVDAVGDEGAAAAVLTPRIGGVGGGADADSPAALPRGDPPPAVGEDGAAERTGEDDREVGAAAGAGGRAGGGASDDALAIAERSLSRWGVD